MSVAPFSILFKQFFPDAVSDSAYSIDFEALYEKGCRGIIFDVDNTLVPHGAPADGRAKKLFERLHEIGYKCLVLSNNKEPRVKSFGESVRYADYIHKAGKPGKKGYFAALKRMCLRRKEALFVGDQIFTDVWGAKRCGIFSILVKPIDKREEIQIVLKRIPERFVLWLYGRSGKLRRL